MSNRSSDAPLDMPRLSALEEIKALRVRFCAAADARDWPALESIFSRDALPERRGGMERKTVHHLHNFQAEFLSDTKARGRWEVVKFDWREGAGNSPYIRRIEWGCYRDVYERSAGGWRIASFRFDLSHASEEYDRVAAP